MFLLMKKMREMWREMSGEVCSPYYLIKIIPYRPTCINRLICSLIGFIIVLIHSSLIFFTLLTIVNIIVAIEFYEAFIWLQY